jgi:hypothetical protein
MFWPDSPNSWGIDGFLSEVIQFFDSMANDSPNLLFVFAAGNEQRWDWSRMNGYLTVCTPGSAKNVVTVGALSQLPV